MTAILRRLPYFDEKTVVVVRNRAEVVRGQQIVIWVSVAEVGQSELGPGTPHFPAILDTGFSHNFGIREEHLRGWAGIQPGFFQRISNVRVNDVVATLHDADVWVHRNQPGRRDEPAGGPPFCLHLNQGIVVYPPASPNAPRMPVLGLRALKWTGLHLSIDSDRCRVWLRPRRWFWFFG